MSNALGSMMVVAREGAFSEGLTRHAVHMAREHHWSLIALHVGSALSNLLEPQRSRYCSAFEDVCARGVEPLARAAREEGVDFTHVVRFGGTETAVSRICREVDHIKCVLVDREADA